MKIIGCPKEPDLGIWAANLGHAKNQPDFVEQLSHLVWGILRHIANFLSPQNYKRIIIGSTMSCPKVASQAHSVHCSTKEIQVAWSHSLYTAFLAMGGWQWPHHLMLASVTCWMHSNIRTIFCSPGIVSYGLQKSVTVFMLFLVLHFMTSSYIT